MRILNFDRARDGLPGRDEAAVDADVGAGDVGGHVTGQQKHQVSDLLGAAEPPSHHLARGAARHVLGTCAGRVPTVAAL
jgi:hypothetical protein